MTDKDDWLSYGFPPPFAARSLERPANSGGAPMVDQLPNGCPQQPDRLVLDTPPLALRDRGQNGPHVAGRFGPLHPSTQTAAARQKLAQTPLGVQSPGPPSQPTTTASRQYQRGLGCPGAAGPVEASPHGWKRPLMPTSDTPQNLDKPTKP